MVRAALGNRVAELRKEQNITQQQLAEAIGMVRTSLSQIETGAYGASDETKRRISDFFGIPIGDIFFNRNVLNPETGTESA